MILFFDTETSDLWKKSLAVDDPGQPWPVTVAAMLTDDDGNPGDQFFSLRIRSDGRLIRDGAAAVHGITTEEAAKTGINESLALMTLCGLVKQARVVVAHNLDFDRDIIVSAITRATERADEWLVYAAKNEESSLVRFAEKHLQAARAQLLGAARLFVQPGRRWVCTMKAATPVCKLPPKVPREDNSYKWPSLDEACEIILKQPPREGHHTAFEDLDRCRWLYLALKASGAIEESI